MRHREKKKILKSVLFWLLPGLVTGALLSVVLTAHEYREKAAAAGAILREGSVSAGLKQQDESDIERGSAFLSEYGYDRYTRLPENFTAAAIVSILCFECAGAVWMLKDRREDREREERIDSLALYLQSVNRGEAKALVRKEDQFSFLEDEIYKTMMELTCTKEEAVRDHQVLSDRIADIAHQLKTPLTSMSLMAELLEEYQPQEAKEYLERLKNQVERLKNLASGLLSLAKLDSHTIVFHREEVGVLTLIMEAAAPVKDIIVQKGISLKLDESLNDQAAVNADRQWTEEAIANILKNCAEHTPKGGSIIVRYEKNPIYTEICIEDSGCGFAKADLPHLFERFYKGSNAAKDSTGIGLALAKTIIENQNGQIQAENTSAGNARFRIRMSEE